MKDIQDFLNVCIGSVQTVDTKKIIVSVDKEETLNKLKINAQFKKIVALSNLIQRIYHNDIRNMLP